MAFTEWAFVENFVSEIGDIMVTKISERQLWRPFDAMNQSESIETELTPSECSTNHSDGFLPGTSSEHFAEQKFVLDS